MCLGEGADKEKGKYGEILTCIPASSSAQKRQHWLCLCWWGGDSGFVHCLQTWLLPEVHNLSGALPL